ncbi:hypothetical protein [Methylocystis rosea]|uniref:hypothetical protein n=1 Tax=Methylocystis rosea TaxID=173366 RepID=UPI00035FB656|nr:hypothetical protein [Methylocystis rosea]
MPENKPVNRKGPDWRTVYANGFGIQFMGIDAIINFSILDDISDPAKGVEDQVSVVLNVQNFKALALVMSGLVAHHEKTTGQVVEINPRVKKNLEDAIASEKKIS